MDISAQRRFIHELANCLGIISGNLRLLALATKSEDGGEISLSQLADRIDKAEKACEKATAKLSEQRQILMDEEEPE